MGSELPLQADYIVVRVLIICLQLVAPLSVAYMLLSYYAGYWIFSKWLGWYALAEIAFYVFVYLPRQRLLQKPAILPPTPSSEQRRALFNKCLPDLCSANGPKGWLYVLHKPGVYISRENLVDVLLLHVFNARREDLRPEWKDELEEYISRVETTTGHKFEDKPGASGKGMMLTLDPVPMVHRPLIWYLNVALLDTCVSAVLLWKGFEHYEVHRLIPCFPPRASVLFSKPSPHPELGYWYRPHRSRSKLPVLFLHGVGMGLMPYVPFMLDIVAADPDIGILAIEYLSFSTRISKPILERQAMMDAIRQILDHHGLSEVVIAAHSYGTFVTTYMLRDPALSQRIAAMVLADPVALLAFRPDLSYNFAYRPPRRATEWLLWYFVCRDPDISRVVSRNMFLMDNSLWKDELDGRKVTVAIGGQDLLLDAKKAREYLTGEKGEDFRWQRDGAEVIYRTDIGHEEVLFTEGRRRPMVEALTKYVRMRERENAGK
ncbi:uncharacterized protein LAESUDRAFT_733939 [Laetiporus sulphureus 93-53]|uniref:AB hydrolase-1 domain-containing protein n=1 Tax=Laetiporus sulphureus 93-53 TaxID=1314785 RepID=A0A165HRA0_9APHY|nr:uncharacterized protein LAESUDRAFT_733939 [Laetiporus sulphureus 93-53]KZT12076.1 hypothetical protein LAESUDRAFT_733939 [Laetiporus sulphureus 93-53]